MIVHNVYSMLIQESTVDESDQLRGDTVLENIDCLVPMLLVPFLQLLRQLLLTCSRHSSFVIVVG